MPRLTGMAHEQRIIDSVAHAVATHYAGGQPVVTATLHDGWVLRCVGFMDGRSAESELRAWLLWLALAVLAGCGGQAFEAGADDAAGLEPEASVEAGEASADAPAAVPDGSGGTEAGARSDGGDAGDAAPDGEAGQPAEACALVTHSDGIGGTWQDCAPLGTCDATEALAACTAYTDGGTCSGWIDSPARGVCSGGAACVCWSYLGSAAGLVIESDSGTCVLTGSGPAWR